jgi:TRAP-type C4-dicarboxylate transport system permease small subunit
MLGFSLGKLLVTAVAILIVWYGFKYMTRLGDARAAKVAAKKASTKDNRVEAEDLVECNVCGSFVAAATAKKCDRGACPYPV